MARGRAAHTMKGFLVSASPSVSTWKLHSHSLGEMAHVPDLEEESQLIRDGHSENGANSTSSWCSFSVSASVLATFLQVEEDHIQG